MTGGMSLRDRAIVMGVVVLFLYCIPTERAAGKITSPLRIATSVSSPAICRAEVVSRVSFEK